MRMGMRVQWAVLAFSIILLMGPITVGPISFAAPPTLEAECERQDKLKKSPDCELLQRLNDLEAELKAKDMELMDKVDLLDAKDMELMDKDDELMTSVTNAQADADTSCATIPVVKIGFGLVTSSTVVALDAFNVGIVVFNLGLGAFNDTLFVSLSAFNVGIDLFNSVGLGAFNVALGVFNVGLDDVFDKVDILGNVLVNGINVFQILDVLNVIPDVPDIPDIPSIPDIPDIPDVPTIPISGMPAVPDLLTINTALIAAADDAVQNLALCT